MTKTSFFLSIAALASAMASAGTAAQIVNHDTAKCEAVPKDEMRPQMELLKKLVAEGWKVRQVKTFNGCYEVYGFNQQGERMEVFFHPKTFEKIGEVKQPS